MSNFPALFPAALACLYTGATKTDVTPLLGVHFLDPSGPQLPWRHSHVRRREIPPPPQ